MTVELADIESKTKPNDFVRWNGTPAVMKEDGSKRERYSRPSGAGKILDDTTALDKWKTRTALQGAAHNTSILPAIIAAGDDKKLLNELAEKAIERGKGSDLADHGTALHKLTEQIDSGEVELDSLPDNLAKRMAEYLACLDTFGLKPIAEYIEVQFVCDELRYAGTGDRIYLATKQLQTPDGGTIEPGDLVGGDLKTNKGDLKWSLHSYEIQSWLYFGKKSKPFDVTTEKRLPRPRKLRADWSVLVHLPSVNEDGGDGEGCDIIWMDMKRGETGARLARSVKDWRNQKTVIQYATPPKFLKPIEPVVEEPILSVPEIDVSETAAWITDRIKALKPHPDAIQQVMREWPEGVPGMKTGGHTPEALEAISGVVADAEKLVGADFIPGPQAHRAKRDSTVIPDVERTEYVPADEPDVDDFDIEAAKVHVATMIGLMSADQAAAFGVSVKSAEKSLRLSESATSLTFQQIVALASWTFVDHTLALAAALTTLHIQHTDFSLLTADDAQAMSELAQQFSDGHLAVSPDGTQLVPTTKAATTT